MVEISVLLYVFDDDEFIGDSIESIMNQSFTDLEIICIDDESTDDSLALLEQYAKKDERIKVYSHKHCGLSTSINNVIKNINGNYVQILKAGTLLKENALQAMLEKIQDTDADFVIANIKNRDKNGKEYENDQYSISNVINQCGDKSFDFDEVQNLILELNPSVENKLYSAQFLQDNEITFKGNCEYSENIFFYESFIRANKVNCLNDFLYLHLDRYTTLKNRDTRKFLNIPPSSNKIMDLFKQYDKLENNKGIYNHLFNRNMKGYFTIKEIYKNEYFNTIRTDLVNLLNSDEIDEFLENIEDYNRKLFEQIIISDNSYEFNRLQKTYYEKIEYNKLLNRRRFLKPYIAKMNEE
ncbi:MAG TPA: glycosyltransferase family 2 protein [Methanosphaera sp.]|nr:glycosyltransferase family 2 protein [Methanosphaera sp.]HII09016.1 glycosyltransferase family 2 protein [Methanosphaera sp.]HIJ15157.1 glycosyltransferase family 2 protein [Methanosphaera sp.]